MNIVTPIPTAVSFTTVNVNTEAARRDNALRETVPALANTGNSTAETALGGEADRLKNPIQPLVYERPQVQTLALDETQQNTANQDNAKDPSAGKDDAEQKQQQRQQQTEVAELKKRETQVRAHEQAHASLGGQHASAPNYEYTQGPDGRRYVVDGEVSIDIAKANSPEATIRKMEQVKAAALAPAEPSTQDLRVASEASQKTIEARNEIAAQRTEDNQRGFDKLLPKDGVQAAGNSTEPNLAHIFSGSVATSPTLTVEQEAAATLESDQQDFTSLLAGRDQTMLKRENVLQSFYQRVSQSRSTGFEQIA